MQLVRNLCSRFIERIKKVLELNGSRLEPKHLKKKAKEEEIYKWEIPEELPPFRIVYNNKEVFLSRKKELKQLKKAKKALKSSYSMDIKRENRIKKSFKKGFKIFIFRKEIINKRSLNKNEK